MGCGWSGKPFLSCLSPTMALELVLSSPLSDVGLAPGQGSCLQCRLLKTCWLGDMLLLLLLLLTKDGWCKCGLPFPCAGAFASCLLVATLLHILYFIRPRHDLAFALCFAAPRRVFLLVIAVDSNSCSQLGATVRRPVICRRSFSALGETPCSCSTLDKLGDGGWLLPAA